MDNMMTKPMRDLLIEHMDRPVAFAVRNSKRLKTTMALVERGWLRYDWTIRPRFTHITAPGREMLGAELANWVEALLRAEAEVEEWDGIRWRPGTEADSEIAPPV